MGDELLPAPSGGRLLGAYPPVGTRATIETPDDEIGMLNRAGRYGWRGVAFTTATWTLEFDGSQWTHVTTCLRAPAGEGWQRIGRWLLWVYWAKPLYLPVLPGNPEPEDFRSDKRLRRALARAGRASGHGVVSGLLGGVRDLVEETVHAVEQAVLGGPPAPSPPAVPSPAAVPSPVDARLFDASESGVRVREHLTRLAQLVPVYAGYSIDGEPVSDRLERIVADLQDLFRRMHARGTAHQRALAQAHYAHILGQLVLVVSPTSLKDVMDKPQLWGDADQRVARVGAALAAVDAEIVTNIRQVNASADLDFQVALQTITALGSDGGLADLYGGEPT